MAILVVYTVTDWHGREVQLDRDMLLADLRGSTYRFWLSERRMPAAIIMCNMLAEQVTGRGRDLLVIDDISHYGRLELDEMTKIPIIGRDAPLDPLWSFI